MQAKGQLSQRSQRELTTLGDHARDGRWIIHMRKLSPAERRRLTTFFAATEQAALLLAESLDPQRHKPGRGVVAKLDAIILAARQGSLLLRPK